MPYTLVEAIDTYLTKVNYPIEESQMQFTLVRELEDWYISAIHDEKFTVLRDQIIAQAPLSPSPAVVTLTPAAAPAPPPAQPVATTTSVNAGRQAADAQFQATLQGLNRVPQTTAAAAPEAEEKTGFFARVGRVFGLGRKKDDEPLITAARPPANGQINTPPTPQGQAASGSAAPVRQISDAQLKRRLKLIRNALATYAGTNFSVPNEVTIYNWQTLRDVLTSDSLCKIGPLLTRDPPVDLMGAGLSDTRAPCCLPPSTRLHGGLRPVRPADADWNATTPGC